MNCRDFEARLQRVLDARRRPQHDPPLAAHAALCSRCAETLDAHELLSDFWECAPPPAVAPDFSARAVRAAAAQARTEQRWRSWAGGAAAALLLAVGVLGGGAMRRGAEPEQLTAVTLSAPPPATPADRRAAPPLAATATAAPRAAPEAAAPSRPVSPADDAAAAPAEPPAALDPAVALRAARPDLLWQDVQSRLAARSGDPAAWREQASRSLRPFAAPFETAVDVLRDAIPGQSELAPPPPEMLVPSALLTPFAIG